MKTQITLSELTDLQIANTLRACVSEFEMAKANLNATYAEIDRRNIAAAKQTPQ